MSAATSRQRKHYGSPKPPRIPVCLSDAELDHIAPLIKQHPTQQPLAWKQQISASIRRHHARLLAAKSGYDFGLSVEEQSAMAYDYGLAKPYQGGE